MKLLLLALLGSSDPFDLYSRTIGRLVLIMRIVLLLGFSSLLIQQTFTMLERVLLLNAKTWRQVYCWAEATRTWALSIT